MSRVHCPRSWSRDLAFAVGLVAVLGTGCDGVGSADAGGRDGAADGTSLATGGTIGATGGTVTTGGSGGTGGSTAKPVAGQSCKALAATCGSAGNDSCCTSLPVPGGTFYRSYDGATYDDQGFPATVAEFDLDKYEVTVGRFRAFVEAGMGTQASPPAPGAGAHPLVAGSGWDSAWNSMLPLDTASLRAAVQCRAAHQTWTETPGALENRPQNCLHWYLAFAFCAWDGGRLPTEAEWNFAAAGGSEQRVYPWSSPPSSTTIDDTYAVYCGFSCDSTQDVGMKPSGYGRWGHADLAGNVAEWMLDWYATPYLMPCNNCAVVSSAASTARVFRGSAFNGYSLNLWSAYRNGQSPQAINPSFGARCARGGS